jgi:hypothetical protein
MSDFELDAFLRSVHGGPQDKQVRFDRKAFHKALKAFIRGRMPDPQLAASSSRI